MEEEDIDVHVQTEEEEEAKYNAPRAPTPASLLNVMQGALSRVQSRTFNVVEATKRKAFETLNKSRTFLANLIRKDHDSLEVDSAISQNMIDQLTSQVNCLLIAAGWFGSLSVLYTIIAGVFIIIGDDGNSTIIERSITIIPPAVIQTIVTATVLFLQQLQIVDKLKELTNVKTDTDYVISKLEPMYKLAERAESLQVLDEIDLAFRGETSSLKQRATRAISKVLKKEDRAVHLRKYRYLMLQELHAKAQHEEIRDLLIRHSELGIPLQDLAKSVEAYGAHGMQTFLEVE